MPRTNNILIVSCKDSSPHDKMMAAEFSRTDESAHIFVATPLDSEDHLSVEYHKYDPASISDVHKMVNKFHDINILVFLALYHKMDRVENITEEDWNESFRTNVEIPMLYCQLLAEQIKLNEGVIAYYNKVHDLEANGALTASQAARKRLFDTVALEHEDIKIIRSDESMDPTPLAGRILSFLDTAHWGQTVGVTGEVLRV